MILFHSEMSVNYILIDVTLDQVYSLIPVNQALIPIFNSLIQFSSTAMFFGCVLSAEKETVGVCVCVCM